MARYQEIADDIRAKIKDGTYPVGSQLPSISRLQAEYVVSGLNTIRAAQQVLAEEGMLESRQGIGVFVTATESAREIDIPAAVAAARDTLTAVLAAFDAQARRSVTFDLDKIEDADFVLVESLREFAARQRDEAEHDADGNAESRLQWAECAESLAEMVDQA
ncbi:MAG TPA: GntR family transcriptional regulator [Rugosimonospora sp.]|nr:GntR family transcriptional regulator [Rugosimonospora sp.]